ncbi:MAG: hypothetical protein IPM32_11195 [Ignavibacteriae bacterium]|nr:hypothetical protein [Ignavibacteriota bacterium]
MQNNFVKIFNKISALILVFPAILFSQTISDSLNFNYSKYQRNIFRTSFSKRLNTLDLNSGLAIAQNSDNFFFGLNENYFSSLVSSTIKNIKDEQSLSLIGEYKYVPTFQIGVLTQNNIYSNDRKIAINEASILHSTIYTKYSPIDQFKVIPYVGYSINKQVNEDDRGAIYGSNILLEKYNLNEFQISSNLNFQNEDISPRKNYNRLVSIKVKNDFDLNLTNLISGDYSNVRKDFYFEADSLTSNIYNISKNIQSRIENRYFIEERIFNSRFNSDFYFDLSGRASYRNIDRITKFKNLTNIELSTFDSQINEFRLDFSGITEYNSESFFGRIKIDYSERDEKYSAKKILNSNNIIFDQRTQLEKRKNNNSQYTTISAVGNYSITNSDNLLFTLLHRKLIYDTPSEDNFDDRDELLSILRLSYLKSFNHLFNFFLNIEGSINHIVYIFAERSSNNNTRRNIKLSSGGEYLGTNLYSKNTFEVSANYTSYDFEDVIPNIKSFSFRQFTAKDSTSLKLYKKVFADFSGYVKLSEQGDFVWSNFTNNPERYLAEYFLEPIFNIKYSQIKIGVGLRLFSLQTFGYNADNKKYLTTKYNSVGPITNFLVRMQNIDLGLYGWYEFISNEENVKRELANLYFSVNWRI